MARRVTPEDVIKFHELYRRYGSYAQVGRETGFSGSTVARYIKLEGAGKTSKQAWNKLLTATTK